jgi:hypothetical protein
MLGKMNKEIKFLVNICSTIFLVAIFLIFDVIGGGCNVSLASEPLVPQAVSNCAGVGDTKNGIKNMQIKLSSGRALSTIDAGSKETKYGVDSVKLGSTSYEAADSAVGPTEIKGRGNSTWGAPKKPYQIKFDKKQNLSGAAKAKKWILLADYFDATSLRTDVAFNLAKDLGVPYQQQIEHVNLYVNCEYRGLYSLTEKIEVGKVADNHGIPLTDDKGVLVESDWLHDAGVEQFYSGAGTPLALSDSKADDFGQPGSLSAQGMQNFISTYNAAETAVAQNNWATVQDLIDVESFAKYAVIANFMAQCDAFDGNFYLYQNGASDKIHVAPGWDYDRSANNAGNCFFQSGENLWSKRVDFFLNKNILRMPGLVSLMNSMYSTYKQAFVNTTTYSNSQYSLIYPSLDKNFQRWGYDSGTGIPNVGDNFAMMSSFLSQRLCGLGIDSTQCSKKVPLYRSAKLNGAGYFYTTNYLEYKSVPQYNMRMEGIGNYVSASPGPGLIPVYRAAHLSNSGYFYTASYPEFLTTPGYGYRQEGVSFYVSPSAVAGSSAVYRGAKYQGGYFYTMNVPEYNTIQNFAMRKEGLAWYAWSGQ